MFVESGRSEFFIAGTLDAIRHSVESGADGDKEVAPIFLYERLDCGKRDAFFVHIDMLLDDFLIGRDNVLDVGL